MVIVYVLGIGLICSGFFLLCHNGYNQMNLQQKKASNAGPGGEEDLEQNPDPLLNSKSNNDCFVPLCFFQVSQVYNFETWIVVCLLTGSTIMLMSLAIH